MTIYKNLEDLISDLLPSGDTQYVEGMMPEIVSIVVREIAVKTARETVKAILDWELPGDASGWANGMRARQRECELIAKKWLGDAKEDV